MSDLIVGGGGTVVVDNPTTVIEYSQPGHVAGAYVMVGPPGPPGPPGEGGATRLHYANVYDGFFAGKNRAQDTSVPTIWANDNHLTDAGLRAWADYIVDLKNPDGSYVIDGTAPVVVWIGDSWIDQGDGIGGPPILADAVHARIPGATVVVKGIGGQTSTQVLARFDADVPADADYVIFNEPGVNDATINGGPTNGLGLEGQLANLAKWVRKVRALGAVPVWTGHVPLGDWPRSRVYHQQLTAIVGDGTSLPTATPASTWSANVRRPIDVDGLQTSIGYGPALSASGVGLDAGARYSTAAGVGALDALGLGSANTAFGYKALNQVATGIDSTAVGSHSFTALTGANGQNTGVGANTGRAVTTGTLNTLVGLDAGYRNDALSTVNATTTGSQNVFVGAWTQARTSAISQATIVGARGKAGQFSTAVGYKADASLDGSVAIGCDGGGDPAVAAAANFIALGTTAHTVHIVGKLRVERKQTTVGAAGAASAPPATPVTYFLMTASDGIEYAVPAYAKV